MSDKGNFKKFIRKKEPKVDKVKSGKKLDKKKSKKIVEINLDEPMRLNRYIAACGICSRRDADELIKSGKIKLNGKLVKEMGVKVTAGKDVVIYDKKEISPRQFVYLLMNKPRNHITTVTDDRGRKTVMDIVLNYTKNRVYPVGRLDRNTTGLLLLTNDGELTEKLTHPKNGVTKLYHVKLTEDLKESDMLKIQDGFELEDGIIKVDKANYADGIANEIGIQIHSGRNRIVRRIFEHLNYSIKSLDRVGFGSLTKKNLPRGQCRFLTSKEVGFLKML